VTGNTVIDALLTTVTHQHQFRLPILREIEFGGPRRTLLVTSHRRENLGASLQDICKALRDLLTERQDLQLVFPVHRNPKVRDVVWSVLGGLERVWLIEPLDYVDFVLLMSRVDLIVTDSGGVQEEAPALGKPVLVTRTTTERPEAVAAGTAKLIGTARKDIVAAVSQLLDDPSAYARMRRAVNPYGDGQAAKRIVSSVRQFLGFADTDPVPLMTDQSYEPLMIEQRTTADA
jgi:UDP-N-acetylglucosamine 2-epimerase (non-hydrolysing)